MASSSISIITIAKKEKVIIFAEVIIEKYDVLGFHKKLRPIKNKIKNKKVESDLFVFASSKLFPLLSFDQRK